MRKVNPSGANLPIEKILNIQGNEISLVLADGQWWIAVKPVCELLGISYKGQIERIDRHHFWSQLPRKYGVVAADKKLREMVCIPERYVYGWLMAISSDSPGLMAYQQECYDVLFNHFHGRFSQLIEKIKIEDEMAQLDADLLKDSEAYRKLKELEERKKKIPSTLKKMDDSLLNGQIRIGFEN